MERKTKSCIAVFIIFAFVIFSLSSIFYAVISTAMINGLTASSLFYGVGKLAGLIGFLFLSLLIISGDTARFFDKFFGMDKIIKFQRKFSVVTFVFVLFHPIFFMLSTKQVLGFVVPNFSYVPMAFGIMAFYILVVIMIASQLYKRISYGVWQYIHILTYVLFFFSMFHALNWGSDAGLTSLKVMYGIIAVCIFTGIFYRTYYKLKQRKNKFTVKIVKLETKDTFSLVISAKNKFLFKAGQFAFLRLNKERLYARHPFTLSSAPSEKDLQFTIKLSGRFTKIASELKKGEEIKIEGPFGKFTLEDTKKDVVFIAGGVGITPFLSLIKENMVKKKPNKITLIYGSRTTDDIIFKKEFDEMNQKWFKRVHVLSLSKEKSEDCEIGFIDKELLKKYVKNFDNKLFYICGPEILKNNAKKALHELGVKKESIIVEDFFW